MAEKKYDLLVQSNKTGIHVNTNNWYNERLKTKYLKPSKPGDQTQNYDTKNWLFLRRGLDDFRDGLPPIGCCISKAAKKGFPSLYKDFVRISEIKNPPGMRRLNRYQTYLTKSSPQKQEQRKYIASVEAGLLNHPLALYPHLEASVAPEQRLILLHYLKFWGANKNFKDTSKKIFENILDILDPQFSNLELEDEEIDILDSEDDGSEHIIPWDSFAVSTMHAGEDKPKADQSLGFEPSFRNMYKWIPQKESAKDSKKSKEKEKLWPSSQSEEEHIRQVTRDFCEWVADLGGETNNIEESTITSLFASGYDTKPALSVPIHVVDLANVPHELRLSAMVPPPAPPEKSITVEEKQAKKRRGESEPTFVKFRYGAWYLNPNTWKKMGYYEPLEDPKQLKKHEMSEGKKRCHELTEELATMHAAKAFDEFIAKKNTRKPEFLDEISEIQIKAALEESKRAASELLVKQKRNNQKKSV